MKYIKKLFGGIDLTWKKLLIFSVTAGIIPGILLSIPALKDTSFTDNGSSYEWWVFFAIIIISNCKKPLEAACKTFVFFLITQPLIYLVQVPFCWLHWGIFSYYPPWFFQTLLTFPGAFLGWYVKKGKWYSLLILLPMLWLLSETAMAYLHDLLYMPPRHLLTTIFCAVQIFVLVIAFFEDKKLCIAGCILGAGLLTFCFFMNIYHQPMGSINVYGEEIDPDMHYTAESSDESIVRITEDELVQPNGMQAEFYHKGSAEVTFTADDGTVLVYKAWLGDDYDMGLEFVEKRGK